MIINLLSKLLPVLVTKYNRYVHNEHLRFKLKALVTYFKEENKL